MPRIDLGTSPDRKPVPHLEGQWADLRERISHAADKEIRRAIAMAREDPLTRADVDTVTVRVYIADWHVKDVATGEPIPWDGTAAAIERADRDVAKRLVREAGLLYIAEDDKGALNPTEKPSRGHSPQGSN